MSHRSPGEPPSSGIIQWDAESTGQFILSEIARVTNENRGSGPRRLLRDVDSVMLRLQEKYSKPHARTELQSTAQYRRLANLQADLSFQVAERPQKIAVVCDGLLVIRSALPRLRSLDPRELRGVVTTILHTAVGLKYIGRRAQAEDCLKEGVQMLTPLIHSDDARRWLLEPLKRQLALMRQDPDELIGLMTTIGDQDELNALIRRFGPSAAVEAFTTFKRGFEGHLNAAARSGEFARPQLKREYDKYCQLYSLINHRLPLVAQTSFKKNVGQYHLVMRSQPLAVASLLPVVKSCIRHELLGQAVQSATILHDAIHREAQWRSGTLPTFVATGRDNVRDSARVEQIQGVIDDAMAFCSETSARSPQAQKAIKAYGIDAEQAELLAFVAHGYTNEDIAGVLRLSVKTVEPRLSQLSATVLSARDLGYNQRSRLTAAYWRV